MIAQPLVCSTPPSSHSAGTLSSWVFSSFNVSSAVSAPKAAGTLVNSFLLRHSSVDQGLTLVHFSAQLERFVWDRGCA